MLWYKVADGELCAEEKCARFRLVFRDGSDYRLYVTPMGFGEPVWRFDVLGRLAAEEAAEAYVRHAADPCRAAAKAAELSRRQCGVFLLGDGDDQLLSSRTIGALRTYPPIAPGIGDFWRWMDKQSSPPEPEEELWPGPHCKQCGAPVYRNLPPVVRAECAACAGPQ